MREAIKTVSVDSGLRKINENHDERGRFAEGPSYQGHLEAEHRVAYDRGYDHGRTSYGFQNRDAGRKGSKQHEAYRRGYYHGSDDSGFGKADLVNPEVNRFGLELGEDHLEYLALADLIPTQDSVDDAKVARFVQIGPSVLDNGAILAARVGPNYYVQDGHHRRQAGLVMGVTHADVRVGHVLSKVDKPRKAVVTVDLSAVGGIIRDDLHDFYYNAGDSLLDAVAEAPFGIFDQINEMAAKYAKDRAGALVQDIEETTRERVQGLVVGALEEGRDPNQLGDDIWGSSFDFSEDRAYTIAITELADAQGAGGLETAKATGVDMEKKWIRGDDTPCDICDPNADAGWIDMDEEFPSGDDTVSGHPHCLCDVVFRVKEAGDDNGDNGDNGNNNEGDGSD